MRVELKYKVPINLLPALREEIKPFTSLDRHGIGYEHTGYTVRSIYFDTPRLMYYHEKESGIKTRRKLRIRAYNSPKEGSWVFLEIKRKIENRIAKHRAPVPYQNLHHLFKTGRVEDHIVNHPNYPLALEDASRFFYHIYRYDLRPVHATVYEREAFIGRFDPSLRITFDRHLRGGFYPQFEDLYREEGLRHVMPGFFTLEVKFNTRFPSWMIPVLGRYDLRNQSISKYCLCTEVYNKQDDNSILVRANTESPFEPTLSKGRRAGTIASGQ